MEAKSTVSDRDTREWNNDGRGGIGEAQMEEKEGSQSGQTATDGQATTQGLGGQTRRTATGHGAGAASASPLLSFWLWLWHLSGPPWNKPAPLLPA